MNPPSVQRPTSKSMSALFYASLPRSASLRPDFFLSVELINVRFQPGYLRKSGHHRLHISCFWKMLPSDLGWRKNINHPDPFGFGEHIVPPKTLDPGNLELESINKCLHLLMSLLSLPKGAAPQLLFFT